MKTQSVTDLIQERRDSLSTPEQKIADYILKNTSQVVHFTVKDLAGASDVSEATVIRMCQHIGFSGFWPLRTALTAALGARGETVSRFIEGAFLAAFALIALTPALRQRAGLWPLAAAGLTLLRLGWMRHEEKAVAFPRGKR